MHVNQEENDLSPQFSIQPNPKVRFTIVYEDDFLIALNKPAGVVTLPGKKHLYDSLLNGAFVHWGKKLQNLGKKRDFGLLHRLDRGTSGIVLIALQAETYDALRKLFETRQIKKSYWAVVAGVIHPSQGQCTVPIAEIKKDGRKQALLVSKLKNQKGQNSHQKTHSKTQTKSVKRTYQNQIKTIKAQDASTTYRVIESQKSPYGLSSLVHCEPKTGRLHQIRIHMTALGSYVLGDFDYAGKTQLNQFMKSIARKQLALHAGKVEFIHPMTNKNLTIKAPLSERLQTILKDLNLQLPLELSISTRSY